MADHGGLAGALGSGIAYTLVRKLVATEHPSVIVLYFPLVWRGHVIARGCQFRMAHRDGVVGFTGGRMFYADWQLALTKAMQLDAASRVTSLSYVQIIFARCWGGRYLVRFRRRRHS